MNVAMVYVYAPSGRDCDKYTERFLKCYHYFPPVMEHDSVIVLNGCKASSELTCLFSVLPKCKFLEHDNSGYDIGGFQKAARSYECDLMLFFGASTWFKRPGWMLRMATAYQKHGRAQYGAMGNRGNLEVNVWPHIRTTAFWMPPQLMNSYPHKVVNPQDRHPFEHGKNCLTEWITSQGLPSWVITWERELLWKDWDSDPQGYSRGGQQNLLAGDRMCEAPYVIPGR